MQEYDSWEALTAALDAAVPAVLESSVAPAMEKIVSERVEKDVYKAYTPIPGGWIYNKIKKSARSAYSNSAEDNTYHRRYSLRNLTSFMDGRNTMVTTTESAPASSVVEGWSFHNRRPGSFFQLLESGNTGIWNGGFPRYPIRNAQKEIDESLTRPSSNLTKAIEQGFSAQGIRVRYKT